MLNMAYDLLRIRRDNLILVKSVMCMRQGAADSAYNSVGAFACRYSGKFDLKVVMTKALLRQVRQSALAHYSQIICG